jgi:flagellin
MFSALSLRPALADSTLSMERLSSGLRINRASDDPAGLVISEHLRTQIASLTREISNTTGAIDKYRTVSSTLTTLRSNLGELRSLAVGATNGAVNSEEAQQAYVAAGDSLVATNNQIVANAEFNGVPTLDGSEKSLADISQLTGIDLSTTEAAEASVAVIDEAIAELDNALIQVGATQKNELETRLDSLRMTRQNLVAAESTLRDTDFAFELSRQVASHIRVQTTLAMMSHSNLLGREVIKLMNW